METRSVEEMLKPAIPDLYMPLPGDMLELILEGPLQAVADGRKISIPTGTMVVATIEDPVYKARWVGTEWHFQFQGDDMWIRPTSSQRIWQRVPLVEP